MTSREVPQGVPAGATFHKRPWGWGRLMNRVLD